MEPLRDFKVRVRELTDAELDICITKLLKIKNSGNPIYRNASPIFAKKNLRDMSAHEQVAVITKDGTLIGIVIYDVVRTWFSVTPIVYEQLVLSVNDKFAGLGRVALGVLEGVALEYGASTIITGNSTMESTINNTYLKDGYKAFNGFVKEVDSDD